MFYGHFYRRMVGKMGRRTSKGNEAKSKIKQSSDILDSNTGGSDLWFNTLPLDQGGALKTG